MTWDVEDRMLSVTPSVGTASSYSYNGAGARIGKSVGPTFHTFAREGADVLSPVLSDSTNNGPTTNYVPGIGLAQGSATRAFASDEVGTQTNEIDPGNNVTSDREYDAFGNPTSQSGSPISQFGYAGDFGYQQDDESGFKNVGHRIYDPGAGRFLTTDPAEDGRNWGTYCSNNPMGAVDPAGLAGGGGAGSTTDVQMRSCYDYGWWWNKPCDPITESPWEFWDNPDNPVYAATVGVGDGVSFGATAGVRDAMGTADMVDTSSPWYQGGQVAGTVIAGAITDGAGEAAEGAGALEDGEAAAECNGGACFVAGTPILLASGETKPIQDVKPGDVV